MTQNFGAEIIRNVGSAKLDLGTILGRKGKRMLSACCVLYFFRNEIQERLLSLRTSSLPMELVKVMILKE